MRLPLIILTLLFIVGCASSSEPEETPSEPPTWGSTWIDEHTILFVGETSQDAANNFIQLASERPDQLRTLIVTSGGGDTKGGMAMGYYVRDHQLDVRVRGACMSSCANYIAPAGRSLHLENDALLGWHGGALQIIWPGLGPIMEDENMAAMINAQFDEWCLQENEFYDSLGVSRSLNILGMQAGIEEQRSQIGWTYTLQQMAALGLTNVTIDTAEVSTSNNMGMTVEKFDLTPEQLAYSRTCEEVASKRVGL